MSQENSALKRALGSETHPGQGSPLGIVRGPLYGHLGIKADVFMPQVHQLGAHLVRLFLFWDQIEPEQGHFVWEAVDTLLDQLGPSDEVWITLNTSSKWATRHATTFQPPSPALHPEEFEHFVLTLVTHCQGRVHYWQCNNEPTNPLLWEGTAADYANQLKVFSRAVKVADPNAIVVLAGAVDAFHSSADSQNPDAQAEHAFFDHLLQESANDFDVFDLHLYGDHYAIPANIEVVRQKMAALGHQKPIFCGEYNGPSFFNFAENLPILQRLFERMLAYPQSDSQAQAAQSDAVAELYEQMATLPPQVQMFMEGCPAELEEKRHRINCREVVSRCLLALSGGVQKMLCWNLANEKVDRANLMHLLFDKHKLFDYERGAFKQPYPAAETLRRMVDALGDVERVQRIDLPEHPGIYLFEVQRREQGLLFVIWERRDALAGEDDPATPVSWQWSWSQAQAMDVFGEAIPTQVQEGQIHLAVSLTPVFIEP
ncbi:hypothetical protein KSF_003510 [Reticulibacter mediterranei]|uniref:Glycoside hydrolase family 5 domain-containing protein n=1 Tax=Reticulibacter mediterranei TaxID=2778369 RepID=A0A8J3IB08_9CHLR|nr:glycoside hydrolase family 44 protein [Reticulibacter mediterranei]GHO90303.1 hypothetical protein KSF_003510 [Reticulibacter mediterranei]